MSTNDSAEVAMVAIWCRHCDAGPGEWCVTKGGHRSGHLHSTRFYDWRESLTEAPEQHPVEWPRNG